MRIKAGDTVRHRVSGETWSIASVSPDGEQVCPAGWPECIADAKDCEMVCACSGPDSRAMTERVAASPGGIRASWAKYRLEAYAYHDRCMRTGTVLAGHVEGILGNESKSEEQKAVDLRMMLGARVLGMQHRAFLAGFRASREIAHWHGLDQIRKFTGRHENVVEALEKYGYETRTEIPEGLQP